MDFNMKWHTTSHLPEALHDTYTGGGKVERGPANKSVVGGARGRLGVYWMSTVRVLGGGVNVWLSKWRPKKSRGAP